MRKVYRLLKRKDISKSLLGKKVERQDQLHRHSLSFPSLSIREMPTSLSLKPWSDRNGPTHVHRCTSSGRKMEDGTRPSFRR